MTAEDIGDDRPEWERVVAGIRARIATAASGDRLPSIAELSAEYDVGATTVKMAVAHLRASGEIRTKRGQGTFVP
jgi:DNA-binding GntR family transcriptional regulator